ncbi:J domain-containing protein [Halogeometricum sp. CBA1124]|uniref:J domain-containing protein n=1 Tax=Halogeometricum sp. CBA1124 TaxID=2668071 RepID=UPI0014294917|nr:J domain-containing protein [Halogeometricum sp. CBA1124]MUV57212.1 J domain-containing protein [Halogeometricum sp. CBA1124]
MSSLEWPTGYERTPAEERTRYPHGFRVDMQVAFANIATELKRMDVDEWRISSGTDHRSDEPHLPYANAPNEPDDPGVVARWTVDGDQFAAPCDRWDTIRDNAQAVAKYLNAKRALDRYGVATVDSEFATARLPAGDEPTAAAAPAHVVLGVPPNASASTVRRAARQKKAETHPDNGGDVSEFKRVTKAEKTLLSGVTDE